MRRSLTATRLLLSCWVRHPVAPTAQPRWRATDDDARSRDDGSNREPLTRLVESREREGLTRGDTPTTGRRDPSSPALAALATLVAAHGLAARQARHALHQLLHLPELLDELADV